MTRRKHADNDDKNGRDFDHKIICLQKETCDVIRLAAERIGNEPLNQLEGIYI